MRGPGAAEDVVQDAMVRVLTYSSSVRGINARGWLLQIVRNTAYSSMKLNRGIELVPLASGEDGTDVLASTQEDGTDVIADLPSLDDDPEASLIKARDSFHMRQLIGNLPLELREILVLRELEELSYKEIAEVTRTPIGTVMSRLWRARQMLVRMTAEQGQKP